MAVAAGGGARPLDDGPLNHGQANGGGGFWRFLARFGGFVAGVWARAGRAERGGGELEDRKMDDRKMGWESFSAVRKDSRWTRVGRRSVASATLRRGRLGEPSLTCNSASRFVFREEATMMGVGEASGATRRIRSNGASTIVVFQFMAAMYSIWRWVQGEYCIIVT